MTAIELRDALSEEVAFFARIAPQTNIARESAKRIVQAVQAYPWLSQDVPESTLEAARREASGLPRPS